jgi:hypothetical protein
MKKREITNLILHVCVGYSLALLVCWNSWFIVLATFIYAFLREQAQHRYEITKHQQFSMEPDFPVYKVEKQTFFGWITTHRMFEVLQWTAGAALARLLWCFF